METDIRSWIKLVESVARDGDAYFDVPEIEVRSVYNKLSRETLVYMSPADFLRVAKTGYDDYKAKTMSKLLKQGKKFHSLPYLDFVHDNQGNAKVIGHEGRHRARALQALGVTQMPVILKSVSNGDRGPAIRWGTHNVTNMPTVLHGETGGQIAMPKSFIF